jgi:hypothetical protein
VFTKEVLRLMRKTKERWRKRRVDIIAQRKDSEFIQSIKRHDGDQIKEDKMDGTCGVLEGDKK